MSYQPLENYGFIGDLHTVALVGIDGSIDYMCFPHFDSPTVFGALLDDDKGGRFRIAPQSEEIRHKQMYLPDTNVLLTRFLSADGVAEVTDFMPVGEMRHTHILVRRVKAVRGPFALRLECSPRFDYARSSHRTEERNSEIWFISEGDEATTLRLRTPVPVEIKDGSAVADFTLQSGESVDFILETVYAETQSPTEAADYVDRAFQHTVDYWREWAGWTSYRGLWQDMVTRSALALKLLTSQRFGSIVAAVRFDRRSRYVRSSRGDRRYSQLGLPLHVGARRVVHGGQLDPPRVPRRGGQLHAVDRGPFR